MKLADQRLDKGLQLMILNDWFAGAHAPDMMKTHRPVVSTPHLESYSIPLYAIYQYGPIRLTQKEEV